MLMEVSRRHPNRAFFGPLNILALDLVWKMQAKAAKKGCMRPELEILEEEGA